MNKRTVYEKYFAANDPESIGGKLVEKTQSYDEHELVRQIDSRIFSAWRYYYGYDPSGFHGTSAISRAGSQGELAQVRINHSRALVNALLNLIVAPKFVWTPRAANLDYDSVRQTELAASVLEHYWHNKGVAQYCTRAVEEAIAFTEGYIHVEWDPQLGEVLPGPEDTYIRTGDIRYTNVNCWDVIRDPNKKSWDELDWVIVRTWRNKYNLAAQFPGQEEEILSCPEDLDSRKLSSIKHGDVDDVPVYVFYHKPNAILPLGREVRFLPNKTILKFDRLRYPRIPLHRVTPAELLGTSFGYSQYLEILGIQELSDSIHSVIATNITTFGAQSISAEESSPLQVDELAGGMRVIYYRDGGKPPEPLQLTKSPPEAFAYFKDLKTYQELLMGLNAVVRGEAQSDRLSGSALALLQSQALQQASTLQGSYVKMVQDVGTTTIQMIRNMAKSPLKIAIVGKHKLNLVQETSITGDQLGMVGEVFVEVGNPISQTAAGRFELAQQLVQMKMVRSPEQLQQVLDTGRLEPLTQANQNELLNLLRENQDIGEGIKPVAMLHDNHLLHGKEHTAPVATPAARRDVTIIEAYTAHMQEHYSLFYGVPLELVPQDPLYRERMLLLTGQTPPPPMMPPGMGPGGAPMAPAPGQGPGPGPEGSVEPEATGEILEPPTANTPEPKMPNPPKQPMTGQNWDPQTGGGIVPR